jgi:predicted ribosome quality control (RQC) complex YloA/Tae2 family protein
MSLLLNWREIERITELANREVQGLLVDRVVVPERPERADQFLKGEWAIRLFSRTKDLTFVFSVRPQHPYFNLIEGKGPKASLAGTRSGFDLSLNKHLSGLKVEKLKAIQGERTAILWFYPDSEGRKLGLALTLIPAQPEALLIQETPDTLKSGVYPILARSKNEPLEAGFKLPDPGRIPPDLKVRDAITRDLATFQKALAESIKNEALQNRVQRLESVLRGEIKQVRAKLKQNQKGFEEAKLEPDYSYFGDLLKAHLGNPPPLVGKIRKLKDWSKDEEAQDIEVPCDPKLSPKDQLEKFYSLAKRKLRRLSEAQGRIETLEQKLKKIETDLDRLKSATELTEIEKIESLWGMSPKTKTGQSSSNKILMNWDGKTFISQEGLMILAGKTKDENLELTFKIAKGNDVWMHVKGRPGAHVVIPLRDRKSASLETLLDAACLCVFYSGGENWGKTEVDYTAKKHVKRIKDSSEASYTHNKTLVIEVDRKRLDRLMESAK